MSRYKSEQVAYNPLKMKYVPLCRLDTTTATVTYFDAVTCTTESKTYHTDYVQYHLSFSASHYPDRLRRLVNEGKIEQYLDDLEQRVGDAIDRQVELWKQSDKEYLTAVLAGDVQKAAGLENCLGYMAREAVFECMVYI
ncbi:MAG: hypothetical protein NC485_00900 [Ruminococcus flavefaciens]|nr:hypothetical protein [Ruminococcus flavefaciens]MCM1058784.1 hypothetical protein [Eubacterium sp.]